MSEAINHLDRKVDATDRARVQVLAQALPHRGRRAGTSPGSAPRRG